MGSLVKCVFGPRLFRIHSVEGAQGVNYAANGLESFTDSVVKWIRFFKAFSYWTSPVLLTFLYRRNFFSMEGVVWMSKFVGGLLIVYYIAVWLRGIGRWMNPEYIKFVSILESAQVNFTPDTKRLLMNYDSEFGPWPVDFRWDDPRNGERKPRQNVPWKRKSRGVIDSIKALPCHALSYVAIHTFGRRMVYPGATSMQVLLGPLLNQGRAKLVEEKRGRRAKLLTEDGNDIDTMFLDRRNNPNFANGNTVVIVSEGNAGFYEIGSMITPIDAGYSVLGWNHPGFAGSTGVPFPSQEQAAIDVVMQYALHSLGFTPGDVVLYGWSIGGYPTTWAAMTYPDVKHVVLDATFDHVIPLAVERMPVSMRSLVNLTVKKYMNLNNAEQLLRYPGPVLLIRRSRDEMITTQEPAVLSSNRGNDLLVQLLQHRYPNIITPDTLPVLWEWLGRQHNRQLSSPSGLPAEELWLEHGVEDDLCNSIIRSYVLENSHSFPCQIGVDMTTQDKIRMTLFLANAYMSDFESTHGIPLPANHFREPWTPQLDLDIDD